MTSRVELPPLLVVLWALLACEMGVMLLAGCCCISCLVITPADEDGMRGPSVVRSSLDVMLELTDGRWVVQALCGGGGWATSAMLREKFRSSVLKSPWLRGLKKPVADGGAAGHRAPPKCEL